MQEGWIRYPETYELRDNIAEILQEVTHDVTIEPCLQPLTGEEIRGNVSDEARSDISARGFWSRGQRAFFDIRVFDPNAQRHQNKMLKEMLRTKRTRKKVTVQLKNTEYRARHIYTISICDHRRNGQRMLNVYQKT